MPTPPSGSPSPALSLVLGGGGPLGIAWETGMLQGWADVWAHAAAAPAAIPAAAPSQVRADTPATAPSPAPAPIPARPAAPANTQANPSSALPADAQADAQATAPDTLPAPLAPLLAARIIGTSAGAIVGAHLAACGNVSQLWAQQHQPPGPDAPSGPDMSGFLAAFLKAKLLHRSLTGFRRSMGRSAQAAAIPGQDRFLAALARSYVPDAPWRTDRDLRVTAVDSQSGELHAWHAGSCIPLPLAVAASCAVPCLYPLVTIHGRSYIDGGTGSPLNAALAAGCPRVLILDPLGRMLGAFSPARKECRTLRSHGSLTLAFTPNDAVSAVIGNHFLDPTRRAEVALLSRAQGRETAPGAWKFLQP